LPPFSWYFRILSQLSCGRNSSLFCIVHAADRPFASQSVLDSVNGNQDKAIDKLLGMSDPEYKEQQPTHVVSSAQLALSSPPLRMGLTPS
jgi:hypothetical protein